MMRKSAAALAESNANKSIFSRILAIIPYFAKDEAVVNTKTPRARTDFSANVTASISLPKTPKKAETCTPGEPKPTSTTYSLMSIFNSVKALFTPASTAANTQAQTAPLKKRAGPLKQPIETSIKELHKNQLEAATQTEKDDILLQKIKLLEHEIVEHAARRVDLFFYTLLAAYNTKAIITEGPTVKQHGKGSKNNGTQACHSSLFSNLIFTAPKNTGLYSLFFGDSTTKTLEGTHFEESLNITVELPDEVNEFDGHMEGRYQRTRYVNTCLSILNRAAQNDINPIEGMNEFFQAMKEFFNHYEDKYVDPKKTETPKSTRKIWEFEKTGTFLAADADTFKVKPDYVYMTLRLNPSQIAKAKSRPASLNEFYQKIQDEVFNSKSTLSPHLAK